MNYETYKAALGNEEKTLEFRRIIGPRMVFSEERQHLAIELARDLVKRGELEAAEPWALRALHDGPSVDAFCLLGDICQDTGDLDSALHWYEAACNCKAVRRFDDPDVAARRPLRLRAIKRLMREEWEHRAPLREINFETNKDSFLCMGFGQERPPCEGKTILLDVGVVLPSAKVDFVLNTVLDDDLEFIAFRPDLRLPHEPNFPHAMWVLPVKEFPEFGDVLLLSQRAAEIARMVNNSDEFWKMLPDGAKFGAFTGKL